MFSTACVFTMRPFRKPDKIRAREQVFYWNIKNKHMCSSCFCDVLLGPGLLNHPPVPQIPLWDQDRPSSVGASLNCSCQDGLEEQPAVHVH